MFIQSDGMSTMLKEMALLMGQYKKDLMKNGFTEEEALQICINWQQSLIMGGEGE